MYRIGPLDNSRQIYFDLTGIENDKNFQQFCSYFDNFDPKIMITKLEQMNRMGTKGYNPFSLSNFDDIKKYIEKLLHIGHHLNEKKKLVIQMQNHDEKLREIERQTESKILILESKGLKNHGLTNMPREAKLKHVRNCVECNKITNFKLLTDDEILNDRIQTDNNKINNIELEIGDINFEIHNLDLKINNIKTKVLPFTKHLTKTYLKHKIFVKDNDTNNEKITFCVDIGEVVVEVPFTEIVALAIKGYAEEQFKKKLQ
ncbi:hypothetical protein Klosneuvirus_16_5 [Klosneuvirus KNV1]|uniref:Uncharacterized protein n=1 Tax=Klosneuvirus KNV1 TaxID=1977640 RepID=A0A1V0SLW3_9VIRU|nr:hypothetical protein Klosneuvirus_16_5 [Klosneuvirus KNV1]